MPVNYPNSFIPYPFSGIQSGFVAHPYHVSFLYDEISGIENNLGLNPLNGYGSLTARITGIETGFFNLSSVRVNAPIVLINGSASVLSGKFASATESGFLLNSDWVSFNGKQINLGYTPLNSNISGNISFNISGTYSIGTSGSPGSGIWGNQYATTFLQQSIGGSSASIDWNYGSTQSLNFNPGFSGNITLSVSNGIPGSNYTLITTQNPSGTTSLLWPAFVKWQGFVTGVPTASGNAVDVFNLVSYGFNQYYATITSNFR